MLQSPRSTSAQKSRRLRRLALHDRAVAGEVDIVELGLADPAVAASTRRDDLVDREPVLVVGVQRPVGEARREVAREDTSRSCPS